jgi:hypothetical protein
LGKKGSKKDRPIPCDYLAGEKSDRADILFNAVRPHIGSLRKGSGGPGPLSPLSILDVTCGMSPLSAHILNGFPGARYTGFDMNEKAVEMCRSRHPGQVWVCSLSNRFVIEGRYDLVIHIGVSSPRYDVLEIHQRLVGSRMKNPFGRPGLVLIEWGDNREGTCDTKKSYDDIGGVYRGAGYTAVDGGEFDIGDAPYPVRRYEILRYQYQKLK